MIVARSTAPIESRVGLLVKQIPTVQRLAEEQLSLVAGCVRPEDSARRLAVANRINEACQHVELDLADTPEGEQWAGAIRAIRALAETVLRENPSLQARGPLSVIGSRQLLDRYVLNRARRRELRRGFGLHRGVRNDEGPSVVVAFTPPGYEQMWHAHTVDEYTLVADAPFVGRFADGTLHELAADDGQMFHFAPHTYHTLTNTGGRHGRTFTLKYPLGLSVWLPALKLTGGERGWAEVRGAARVREGRGIVVRSFEIRDAHHAYTVNTATLAPGAQLNLACEHDGYVYILSGQVEVRRQSVAATAEGDNLVVAEPTPSLCVRAIAGARLYWPSDIVQ